MKWEYKTLYHDMLIRPDEWRAIIDPQLDALGKDGWELVAVVGVVMVFRRPARG